MKSSRKSGVLLHITSLPSRFGMGDLGPGAYAFADFLSEAGQSLWQVLPFNPVFAVCGYSPYCSPSAFAGNPLFISPDLLLEEGLLVDADLDQLPDFAAERVEFERGIPAKYHLLQLAYERFRSSQACAYGFEQFCRENAHWLDDYSLFVALKEEFDGAPWSAWPRELRERVEGSLAEWRERLSERVLQEKFYQCVFFKQWSRLKGYCNERSIQIFGDVPIYVSHDSADVWANPWVFKLDENGFPTMVAGVPPDYFSVTGQLWGNPVYDWEALRRTGYHWWVARIGHNLKLFDLVRMDHFRGFIGYWEVPSSEKTAINGKWVEAPAGDFFDTLLKRLPYLPIIAEDLGIITPDVREVMAHYGFPGMKLLHFAFGDDMPTNPYIPHNHRENCVVYTGTHDNNTTRGWFVTDLSDAERDRIVKYLGRTVDESNVHWELTRAALMSVASVAVIPLQDLMGLGAEARMNQPSTTHGNWGWRFSSQQLTPELTRQVFDMTRMYGRI